MTPSFPENQEEPFPRTSNFSLVIKMQIHIEKLRNVLLITYTFNLKADSVLVKRLLQ